MTRSRNSSRGSPRYGFALVEILVVITLLTLMVGFVGATLWALLRTSQADATLFNNLRNYHTLADRFRSDVVAAAAAPAELGIIRANPHCLILRLADSRHIIYQAEDQGLWRIELSEEAEPVRAELLSVANKQVDFSRTDDDRLLSLRMVDLQPYTNRAREMEIVAALLPEKAVRPLKN